MLSNGGRKEISKVVRVYHKLGYLIPASGLWKSVTDLCAEQNFVFETVACNLPTQTISGRDLLG